MFLRLISIVETSRAGVLPKGNFRGSEKNQFDRFEGKFSDIFRLLDNRDCVKDLDKN
jgi:hypothetical protein